MIDNNIMIVELHQYWDRLIGYRLIGLLLENRLSVLEKATDFDIITRGIAHAQ